MTIVSSDPSSLASDLRDEPWLDDRITLFGLFVESYLRLTGRFAEDVENEAGLSIAALEVLLHIARRGDEPPAMTDLASAVAFTSGGLTRLADRLSRDGLVERAACPTDRRVVHLVLTDAGRDVLRRAAAVHVAGIQRELVDRLDEHDRAELERILRIVRRP